jgi:hypothetical protein
LPCRVFRARGDEKTISPIIPSPVRIEKSTDNSTPHVGRMQYHLRRRWRQNPPKPHKANARQMDRHSLLRA